MAKRATKRSAAADQTVQATSAAGPTEASSGSDIGRDRYLDLAIGDIVDIGARRWICILSYDAHGLATVIKNNGEKVRLLSAGFEIEIAPKVWATRVDDAKTSKLRLKFIGPKSIPIKRRREYDLGDPADDIRLMAAARSACRWSI